ncbi:MAG: TIGR04282 family arsenosugar biosynthesis glycosyltransferase [Acidobacteriota bacterium]
MSSPDWFSQLRSGRPIFAVFTRLPRKGQVKTRLAPLVGVNGAVRFHRAFLRDTLDRVARCARRCGADVALAYAGGGLPDGELRRWANGALLIPQAGGDLGDRLREFHRQLFAGGSGPVIVVGSDSPTLPEAHLEMALRELQTHAAVLDPAADGGYVLLGVSRPLPALLEAIPWGTDEVFAATCQRANRAGTRLAILPGWYDVDDPDGLARLRATLTVQGSSTAPETARVLAALDPPVPRRPGPGGKRS